MVSKNFLKNHESFFRLCYDRGADFLFLDELKNLLIFEETDNI